MRSAVPDGSVLDRVKLSDRIDVRDTVWLRSLVPDLVLCVRLTVLVPNQHWPLDTAAMSYDVDDVPPDVSLMMSVPLGSTHAQPGWLAVPPLHDVW